MNKMKLNENKSKVMVFNRTRNFQFSTRIHLDNTLLELISGTRLLGTVISSDCMYIRSVIEFNCSVWFSSITQDEKNDLERIQKVACKIILKDSYANYDDALKWLNIQKPE